MGWLYFFYELGRLLAVSMRGKTYLRYVEVYRNWSIALHTLDQVTFFQIISNRALCAIPCYNDTIPGVMTPPFQ
jgi:hypothetical protein